jgi:hypothetical protein
MTMTNKNKVALLVLGGYASLILDEVLELFDKARFRIFLHVDAKQDLANYIANLKNIEKVTLIQNRVEVFRGGFSEVEAEIMLIEAALQYPDVSNLILLSDDSAPLVSPDMIYDSLVTNPDRITCVPDGHPRHWYDNFFYSDSKFSSLSDVAMEQRFFTEQDLQSIQRMEALRRRGKKQIPTVFFGRQWWALGRPSAFEMLHYIKNDEHFVDSFRFSLFPAEVFFSTIYRTCFPTSRTLDSPTYADYGRRVNPYGRQIHPWVYSSSQEIRDTKFDREHLFVRKINPDLPEVIRDFAQSW